MQTNVKEQIRTDLAEQLNENNFYSKMAMKKAGHTGLLLLSLYVLEKEKSKGKNTALTKGIFVVNAILFLLDDIEVIVHGIKLLVCQRRAKD